MIENQYVQSKYSRLCIEFKKLREKHNVIKDRFRDNCEHLKLIEEKMASQCIQIRNADKEKEMLIFQNQHLSKQCKFFQEQIACFTENSCEKGSNVILKPPESSTYDALTIALKECSNLREELILQSSNFLAHLSLLEAKNNLPPKTAPNTVTIAIQTSPLLSTHPIMTATSEPVVKEKKQDYKSTTSRSTHSQCTSSLLSSSEDALLAFSNALPKTCFSSSSPSSPGHSNSLFSLHSGDATAIPEMSTLVKPTKHHRSDSLPVFNNNATVNDAFLNDRKHTSNFSNVSNTSRITESNIRERLLMSRINQLEWQIAENSLKQNIEFRRTQLACKRPVVLASFQTPATDAVPVIAGEVDDALVKADFEKLLTSYFDARLHEYNERLIMFTSRSAAAYEEIRHLNQHLESSFEQIQKYKLSAQTNESKVNELEDEIEATKLRTSQQLSDMSMHLAKLTDEIHYLRANRVTQNGAGLNRSNVTHISKEETSPSTSGNSTQDKMNSFFNALLR